MKLLLGLISVFLSLNSTIAYPPRCAFGWKQYDNICVKRVEDAKSLANASISCQAARAGSIVFSSNLWQPENLKEFSKDVRSFVLPLSTSFYIINNAQRLILSSNPAGTKFRFYSNSEIIGCNSNKFCGGSCSNDSDATGVFYRISLSTPATNCLTNDVENLYTDLVFCQYQLRKI